MWKKITAVRFSWLMYAALGEKDRAFEQLEKTYQKRSGALVIIKANPWFGDLQSDERFTQLLNKMGLE